MGDISYKPLIEEMTWSYSRISSYYDCPYKWYLKYIMQKNEPSMFYASYGSFIHKILEKYYKGELQKSEMPGYFLSNFKEEVKGSRPEEKIVRSYISGGLDYLRNFNPLPYNVLSIEQKYIFDVHGKPFVGFQDYVGELDGEIYIVDNKSRNLKQRSHRVKPTINDQVLDDMQKQLYLYSAAIKQQHGSMPGYQCFNCFRNGEFIAEKFDPEKYIAAMEWAHKAIEEIENAEEFPAITELFKCRWLCGFHGICRYYQAEMSERRDNRT